MIRAAVQNPIAGLTLDKRLERNRAQIIYDIKKNIAIGLTQGDSYTTVAKRITKSVNNDYTKAMLITRTETHRVREQGFEDSGRAAQNDLMGTGYVLSKTWRSMQDGSVRHTGDANHVKMHGVTVLADEYFELVGGVKAFSPGMSGTPQNDCNCRCYASRDFMSAKEFEKKTGRVLPEKYHKRKAESEVTEQEQIFIQNVDKNDLDIAGESGIINKKVSDRIVDQYFDENARDSLFNYEEIENELLSSSIGRDIAHFIEYDNYTIVMDYDLDADPSLMGAVYRNDIIVYAANHTTVQEVAETIIHEAAHKKYSWDETQEGEVNCRLLEWFHSHETISDKMISEIVSFVRAEYSDFPEGDMYGY